MHSQYHIVLKQTIMYREALLFQMLVLTFSPFQIYFPSSIGYLDVFVNAVTEDVWNLCDEYPL